MCVCVCVTVMVIAMSVRNSEKGGAKKCECIRLRLQINLQCKYFTFCLIPMCMLVLCSMAFKQECMVTLLSLLRAAMMMSSCTLGPSQ